MNQDELAEKIPTSQPSIALTENADVSVSIESLIQAMLATGATPKEIGEAISSVG